MALFLIFCLVASFVEFRVLPWALLFPSSFFALSCVVLLTHSFYFVLLPCVFEYCAPITHSRCFSPVDAWQSRTRGLSVASQNCTRAAGLQTHALTLKRRYNCSRLRFANSSLSSTVRGPLTKRKRAESCLPRNRLKVTHVQMPSSCSSFCSVLAHFFFPSCSSCSDTGVFVDRLSV